MPGQANTSEQDMKKRVRNNRIASKYVSHRKLREFLCITKFSSGYMLWIKMKPEHFYLYFGLTLNKGLTVTRWLQWDRAKESR